MVTACRVTSESNAILEVSLVKILEVSNFVSKGELTAGKLLEKKLSCGSPSSHKDVPSEDSFLKRIACTFILLWGILNQEFGSS